MSKQENKNNVIFLLTIILVIILIIIKLVFNIFNNIKTIENFKKCGDMILFKSHILHKVLPTKKGIRKTLAIFFEGPNFR